jgi:hypothetical protein
MKYELTTIKDIYDKIPTDRIDDCMKELAFVIEQTLLFRDLFTAIGEASCQKVPPETLKFPESFEWNDDGKCETTINIKVGDKTVMTAKYTKHANDE